MDLSWCILSGFRYNFYCALYQLITGVRYPSDRMIINILKQMKRSTENMSARKMKTFLNVQRSSLTQQDKIMLTPLEAIFSDCPFTHAIASVGPVIEDIMQKVNSDIKYIEEKRYFQELRGIIAKQEAIIQINHAPDIEFSFDTNCPEAEPEPVQNDRICLRECVLETRTFQHQKTHSSPYSKHSKTSSRNSSQLNISFLRQTQNSMLKKPGFVALPDDQPSTELDTATLQFYSSYRQKLQKKEELQITDVDVNPPNLLVSKKTKHDKEHNQYNFDYNGDKIAIGPGMIQKSSQMNVLKTEYRVHKDRQEDVRAPRKVFERISLSRLPSLYSKKHLATSSASISQLKRGIHKQFTRKACKLSSIKSIERS